MMDDLSTECRSNAIFNFFTGWAGSWSHGTSTQLRVQSTELLCQIKVLLRIQFSCLATNPWAFWATNFIGQKWPRDSCPMSSRTSTAFNEKKTKKTRTVKEQNTRKYYISKWKREKKKKLALADSRITAKYDMPIGTWWTAIWQSKKFKICSFRVLGVVRLLVAIWHQIPRSRLEYTDQEAL